MNLFHPELHPIFEAVAFTAGFAVYRYERSRRGDFLSEDRRWAVIAAAATGALVGSKVLGLFESAPRGALHLGSLFASGGKTIVGGLLGGWLLVEIAKRIVGIRSRTGDLFVVPICLGVAIGRVGCFLAGLADETYGRVTSLPWGVDFGDGLSRHPTQLYEVVFVSGLGVAMWCYNSRPHVGGRGFRIFMAAYLLWRLLIDLLKPEPLAAGLSMIQWACVAGLLVLTLDEAIQNVGSAKAKDEL